MKASEILQLHHLKCTACRAGILDALLNADTALSENQIKNALHNEFDRTTFYRTFKTLVEKNVLHSITLHDEMLYMVNIGENNLQKDHYHFYCSLCQKVLCIQPANRESIAVPQGFKINQAEIILQGTCEKCNHQENN